MIINDLQNFIQEINIRMALITVLLLNAFFLIYIAFYKKSRRSK